MSTITPDGLADYLADLAASPHWGTNTPEPRDYLRRMAGKARNDTFDNIVVGAFARITDPAGYPWISESVFPLYTEAAANQWSWPRFLNKLCCAVVELDAIPAVELAQLAADMAEMDRMAHAGFTPRSVHPGAGIILTRD